MLKYDPLKGGDGDKSSYDQYMAIANGDDLDGYYEGAGVYWAIRRAARDVAIGMMRAAIEAGASDEVQNALHQTACRIAPD